MRSLLCAALLLAGCGDEPEAEQCPEGRADEKMVVTADWLNGTLTVFGYDRLVDPRCSAAAATVGTVDLSDYAPGPLEVEITPDGTRAIVSVGSGFLPTFVGGDAPPGGTLLIVDLESRAVLHEIAHDEAPMGIAIHPNGKTAYVAYYGTIETPATKLRVLDIDGAALGAEVELGGQPEQIALSPDGSIGLVNVDGANAVRVFQTSDPLTTLSMPVASGVDPGGSAFFDDHDALVANSIGFSLSLVAADNPIMPVVDDTIAIPDTSFAAPYGVTRVPEQDKVLVTTQLDVGSLAIVDTSADPPTFTDNIALAGGTFPLGVAVDAAGRYAFVAHPSDHVLSIVDLATREVRGVTWLERAGPTYVAVQP